MSKKKIDMSNFFEDNSRKVLMCECKKQYSSYNDAMFIAQMEQERGRAKNLHIYQCPYCHKWHISHR